MEVFNFEVEDCHTYFVGDHEVLVHNADCGSFKKIDPTDFETRNNLPQNTFHKVIKPKIKATVKPNYRVGNNPDIMLNKVGDIAYQGANGRGFQEIGRNISEFLKGMVG